MLKTIKVTIIPDSVGDRQKEITGKIGDLCFNRQEAAPGEQGTLRLGPPQLHDQF